MMWKKVRPADAGELGTGRKVALVLRPSQDPTGPLGILARLTVRSQQLLQIGGGAGAMALSSRRCCADALLLYFWQSLSCSPVWLPQLSAVEAVKGQEATAARPSTDQRVACYQDQRN
jgi:hypothetical protein